MLLGHWHAAPDAVKVRVTAPADGPFETHLHGRDLVVMHAGDHCWCWAVASPHGAVLAQGIAPSRDAAEQAAEDEATAVHPPSDELLDLLLR